MRPLVILQLLCCALPALAQVAAPLPLAAPVKDKNFYLLSLVERTRAVAPALAAHPDLARIAGARRDALHAAAQSCQPSPVCYTAGLRWSEADIGSVAAALGQLYRSDAALRRLVDGPLRSSGQYVRYHARPGDELLAQAWRDAAAGMNRIFDVYGNGAKPRYPAIDAPAFDVKSDSWQRLLHTAAGVLYELRAELPLFFQPSLETAVALLDLSHRDEAGRFEPLDKGENRAALARIATIAWGHYPYTVIVVPGSGPDRAEWSLSPYSKLRNALAARRYREGKAPLILVSGGFVHPNQTPYAEAVEMKKSLMADFGVPAAAILIDPHARHTTTNLRNAARLMYRYGIPFDRLALIVTDSYQSAYIEKPDFASRCLTELDYLPYGDLKRVSPFDL